MHNNTRPPLYQYQDAFKAKSAGIKKKAQKKSKYRKFTADSYNNIVNISRVYYESALKTCRLYTSDASTLEASLRDVYGSQPWTNSSQTRQYLKLTFNSKAARNNFVQWVNDVKNGGKLEYYYYDEDGNPVGRTRTGNDVLGITSVAGLSRKSANTGSNTGNVNTSTLYITPEDDEVKSNDKPWVKYVLIAVAIVAIVFIVLKNKKII